MPIVGQLIVFSVPFFYVVITGNFKKGLFQAWFLFVAWYVLLLFLNPLFVPIGIELIDGPELFAAIIVGWLPGLVISGLGILVRKLILKFGPSMLETKEKEIIIERRDSAEGPEVS